MEPADLYVDDGHLYLWGYCLEWQSRSERRQKNDYIEYRVQYMVSGSAEILPTKVPPGTHKPRVVRLCYELSPIVARNGVTRHFANMEVREDAGANGWTVVTAEAKSAWRAAKKLMHYGENCRVLEPPEMVALVRKWVGEMARMYGVAGEL